MVVSGQSVRTGHSFLRHNPRDSLDIFLSDYSPDQPEDGRQHNTVDSATVLCFEENKHFNHFPAK
jgi:hypothetical protein